MAYTGTSVQGNDVNTRANGVMPKTDGSACAFAP